MGVYMKIYIPRNGKSLSRYDLQKTLKGKNVFPNLPASYKQVLIYRITNAFEHFLIGHNHLPRYKNEKRFSEADGKPFEPRIPTL